MGAVVSCERSHWGLRWSSQWGHGTREGRAEWAQWCHASAAIEAFGAVPHRATKYVKGVPK
eukprot:3322665-Pyramimonas_sp.AAC.1